MIWSIVLALLAAVFVFLFLFGFQAFRVFVVAAGTAVLAEMGMRKFFKARQGLHDGSAVLTALLLALLLPASLPSWQVAIASGSSVILGKEIFGGLGQNPFNPALVGRALLLTAFPSSMSAFRESLDLVPFLSLTSAILVGGTSLILARVIGWEIPLVYLSGIGVFSWILGMGDGTAIFPWTLVLCAFFIVTDFVTSPFTRPARLWFAFGCSLLTVAIRKWSTATDGMTYGVLLMNALGPWLDHHLRSRGARGVGR